MLPTDAPPRPDTANGELVPHAEQDCTLWDVDKIAEGVALITKALPRRTTGPYQLQAAIAQIHDEAPNAEETHWPQIKALNELLLQISDNPMVVLNHAVAVAIADGPTQRPPAIGNAGVRQATG